MRVVRHRDLSPRVELLPLIDVIFLLLTFFIYSMVLMVHARLLPVQMVPVAPGTTATGPLQVLTIDRDGRYHLNGEPLSIELLGERLAEVAGGADQPTLYIAVEDRGQIDRGPLLIELIGQVQALGIHNIAFIGGRPDG